MEPDKCIRNELGSSEDGIVCIDRGKLSQLHFFEEKYKAIRQVIDYYGIRSGKAQGLPRAITSEMKLATSRNRLYLYYEKKENKVAGILKVGKKKLFIRDQFGTFNEITPLCVLDFYVHESMQRKGIGKKLFKKMLKEEKREAMDIAYDRPSPKLLAFLKKYYSLSEFNPQANNFVVFKKYFTKHKDIKKTKYLEESYLSVSHSPLTEKRRNINSKDMLNSSQDFTHSPRRNRNECTYQ